MPVTPVRRASGRERIELKDLRNFLVVSEELNITRAAKRLGMQQSPLSRSLKRLQTELALKLLDTTGNRVALTFEGQHLALEARRLLRQVADLHQPAQGPAQGPRFRVGFTFSAGSHLPRLLTLNQAQERPALISLSAVLPDEPAPSYGQILIAPPRMPQPGIRQVALWHEPLLAAVPTSHPLSCLSQVMIQELGKLGTIYLPSDLRRALDPLPRTIRLRDMPYLDAPTVSSLLMVTPCSALLPASLSPVFHHAGLTLKPVADLPPIALCAHLADASDPSLELWVETMAQHLASATT